MRRRHLVTALAVVLTFPGAAAGQRLAEPRLAVEDPLAQGVPAPGESGLPRPVLRVPVSSPRPHELGVIETSDPESWPEWRAAINRTFGTDQVVFAQRFDPGDVWDADGSLPRPFRILAINWQVEAGEPVGDLDVFLMEDDGGHKADQSQIMGGGGWTVAGVGPGVNTLDVSASNIVVDPPRMFHAVFQGGGGAGPVVAADDGLPAPGGSGDMHLSFLGCSDECFPGCSPARFGLFLTSAPDGSTRGNNLRVWLDVDFLEPEPAPLFVRHADIAGCNRCAWGDADGDGDLDALDRGTLWLNQGDGTLLNVRAEAMPAGLRSLNGALFADFDRDGDLDIFGQTGQCTPCQNSAAPNYDTILENVGDTNADGVPEFVDRRVLEFADAFDAPIPGDDLPTEGAAVSDFNNDGWLDVYLANHVDWDTGACWPDQLWINDGPPNQTFTQATAIAGLSSPILCGRGVTPGDYDGDGDVDVFVSNYRLNEDLLWENDGVDAADLPFFTNVANARGVRGLERRGAFGHGIGSAFGDVNEDGYLDLFVGNLAHSNWLCFSDTTKLFLSQGPAGNWAFEDRRPESGIAYNEVHSDASFADFDNDGDLDVVITQVYDGWRTSVYRNLGDVNADGVPDFEDVFAESGIGQRSGWGSAWADFDEDGDVDLWTRGGLFVNQAADAGTTTWLQVDLQAGRSNPQSIGARIVVEFGGRSLLREVFGSRGTSSQDTFRQHFGLDGADVADTLRVTWPSGCELELFDVPANRILSLQEPDCLSPRFRIDNENGAAGRPQRIACVDETLRFVDDSGGAPTSWEWDFDGDGLTDATGPEASWTWAVSGQYLVTLTVDDGVEILSVTRPVRIDLPPPAPASGAVEEIDANPCTAGLRIVWDPVDWGPAGSGVYNLYRGLDEADASSRPPIALGLQFPTLDDFATENNVAYVYVAEAEDSFDPGGCAPGPHHGGNTARLVIDAGIPDRIQIPGFETASARDASDCAETGILVEWEAAVFHGGAGGSYHVYREEGRCPEPMYFGQPGGDTPLATGVAETSFLDTTALPGIAYTYMVQAEDRRPGFCLSGILNRGSTGTACVAAEIADLAGGGGSADPGEVLRVSRDDTGAVLLDWSPALVAPLAGEAWGLLQTDPVEGTPGTWTLLAPGRLAAPDATDDTADGIPLRYYRATILDAGDCPADDPYRP